MQSEQNKYVILIPSNRRPDRVLTYNTLRRIGYTGPIVIVIDDLDPMQEEYKKKFEHVVVFDKKKLGGTFDVGDNFGTFRGVVYARNACFDIARNLGYKYFLVLDDDYTHFQIKFNQDIEYAPKAVRRNIGEVFEALLEFFISANLDSLAVAQGGDFIGGENNKLAQRVTLLRKLMNLYVLSVDKPFEFMGRINEDVNVYTNLGVRGKLFFTINQITLEQTQTQSNPGGMTELYLDSGTYVKSFYSVLFQPSCVSVALLQDREHARLHHRVHWRYAAPKILNESIKKKPALDETRQ